MLEAAGTILDDVVALRRDVHRHPELGLDNPSTQQRIIAALDGLPLAVRAGQGLTSVVADLDGEGSGQPATVLLRADTDALPMTEESGEDFCSVEQGRAHACGHDATQRCWSERPGSCQICATGSPVGSGLCSSPGRRGPEAPR